MSSTTKKKHVTKEVLEEFPLPRGSKRQVVKVTAARGNNLHEVQTSEGEVFLVSMPTKFRKHVWIKRGDFILVEPIEEGGKVKAEISHILFKEQIKHIQENGLWPESFVAKPAPQDGMIPQDLLPPSDDENSSDDMAGLAINLNRVSVAHVPDESDSDDDDDNEDSSSEDDPISECRKGEKANDITDIKSVVKAPATDGCPVIS